MSKEEAEETIEEVINFVIDEKRSTTSSKFIIRKKKVIHKQNDIETHSELFEDTFTIPLHKFNLNLILSQTKVHNIEETIILERSIQRSKQSEDTIEIEELKLPCDSMNLENVLPMIDFNEIGSIVIKEIRKQIVKKEFLKKGPEILKQVNPGLFKSWLVINFLLYPRLMTQKKRIKVWDPHHIQMKHVSKVLLMMI